MAFLLCFVFFLVFILAILPDILPGVSNKLVQYVKEEKDEKKLREELIELRAYLRTINMADEFAKYAKTERKINKISEQLKKYTASRSEVYLKVKLGSNVAFRVLQLICFIMLMYQYRYEPVLQLPADCFYPISSLIAIPTGIPGAIGLPVWMLVCRTMVRKAINIIKSTRSTVQ